MISKDLVVLAELCGIFAFGGKKSVKNMNHPGILSISIIIVTFCSDKIFNLCKSGVTRSCQRMILDLRTCTLNLMLSNNTCRFILSGYFSKSAYFFALVHVLRGVQASY